jgi:hypothetical protein
MMQERTALASESRSSHERFCKFWQQKPDTPEGKLAEAHKRAQADFDSQQTSLIKCLRIEKKGDKLIPVFCAEAATLAGPHWDAEKRILDIKADIEAFLGFTGGELALSTLADQLSRARRLVSDAEHTARVELERAIRNGSGSINEAQESPIVQKAFDRRDRLLSEMGPTIQELERKLADAKAILEKY